MLLILFGCASKETPHRLVPVADGWANNSVNVTIFRKNSLVTHGDTQYIAFYDPDGVMTLGKRALGEKKWTLHKTQYTGNVSDAHNIISLMVDGDGYVHVSWDHHGHPLRYAKGVAPGSLELGEKQWMTGMNEDHVTYPEFFRMPDGGMLFLFRDGRSGSGNLVINRYFRESKSWVRLHSNLIDGEGERNAYWQACVDNDGVLHLSWVWRETSDVATNHDLCYARSTNGGLTWTNSRGEPYELPIRQATAEIACAIPQNSELINQTAMTTDAEGNPYIATYWREAGSTVPQYHIVYNNNDHWQDVNLGFRQTPFSLSGAGTKRIPISRPQVIADVSDGHTKLALIFRDEEREERVSMAVCDDIAGNKWTITDLTDFPVGAWEPSFDTELWREQGKLHLFVQPVEQVDGEGRAELPPTPVQVLEVNL